MDELNYQLGLLAGELIYHNYLPTLSTDMLKTKNVIEVSEEDTAKNETLKKQMIENSFNGVYEEWLKFYKPMQKKYLPEKIECAIQRIEPTNLERFKKGINDYLWDCDCSYYRANDDFWETSIGGAWCSIITLNRN